MVRVLPIRIKRVWQYTDLYIFWFVSLLCLRRTLRLFDLILKGCGLGSRIGELKFPLLFNVLHDMAFATSQILSSLFEEREKVLWLLLEVYQLYSYSLFWIKNKFFNLDVENWRLICCVSACTLLDSLNFSSKSRLAPRIVNIYS